MKEVKEKQHMKSPKTQDPMRRMPRTAQKLYGKFSEQIPYSEESFSSPDDYAMRKTEEYVEDAADKAYHGVRRTVQKTKDEVRDLQERIRERNAERSFPEEEYPDKPFSEHSSHPAPKTRETDEAHSSGTHEKQTVPSGAEPEHVTPSPEKQREILRQRYGHETAIDSSKTRSVPSESTPVAETVPYAARFQEGGSQHAAQPAEGQSRSVRPGAGSVPAERTAVRNTFVSGQNTISKVRQIPKKTVKGAGKTVKTADRTVKTTRATVKTAERTAKTAEKTAKTAEKAAKAAKEAAAKTAQAAVKTAQTVAKAVEAAVKAIISGVKELIAAIAAGGWVAVVVVLIAMIAALLAASCFGLFWSNDTSSGSPMTAVISSVDHSYSTEIEKAVKRFGKEIEHDEIEVEYKGDNNDGDSVTVNNWNDVLAVFAVLNSTGDDPLSLVEVSDETEPRLREVFFAMNRVTMTYSIKEEVPEDAPLPTPDEEGNIPKPDTVTVLVVEVHQRAMTYKEAAQYFGFDETQTELLDEMMSPAYYGYYAKLIGVDVYGGTDYTQIVSHLPSNSKGAEVVKAALTRLGCPYLMGAKGSTKFDCSGLAYWSIKKVDPELGDRMYTNAAGQAKYCYDRGLTVGRSELQPGDLVFWVNKKCEGCHRWKEIHHVGIYIGEGRVIEAASGKGRVLIRDLWETKNYPILMFGRPYQ